MIRFMKPIVAALLILLMLVPSFALAESDHEEGDGWEYQDGTLTIIENSGLKDFLKNDQDKQTGEWKYQHSVSDVETLVIGRDVTSLVNEIYDWDQITPQKTIVEPGNDCFDIDNGWVMNTKTKTLYGAANVPEKQLVASINDLPEDIVHIGDGAFYHYQNMTSISLPLSIVSIGNRSFMWCKSLAAVSFPDELQTIGYQAFEDCSQLNQLFLDHEIRTVGSSAFAGCINMGSFYIKNAKLTKISFDLFGACYKMQIIELPETAIKIETLAFRICYALHTLIVNASDMVIEDKAFYCCDNLRQIVFTKGTPKSFGESLFSTNGETPDGRYYISDSTDNRGEPIPYPILYYTAAYAGEWAPNGETEWNGYPIEEISQGELSAILAEARGEPVPSPIATATPTPVETPVSTASTQEANEPNRAPLIEGLLALLIAAIVACIVFVGIRGKQKRGKSA
ncbi:MAG: leucine-rich repeat domain-containing protein [Clostridiales bacterium]|nr:leucine-rich repeat domain-containing protein [Clostridiales bacterium]